uniref:Uncharacterized protein n=2 Tax=Oryza sativa subsp. japonica TaxID=39947 RepID=A0A5S6RC01_ORYSJ|nr:Hypothetical protein [Oryza sativa Japonica Group]AAP53431.1 hypothetical protein LOC_Os10g23080 [Oryza sativa Japonica Group]
MAARAVCAAEEGWRLVRVAALSFGEDKNNVVQTAMGIEVALLNLKDVTSAKPFIQTAIEPNLNGFMKMEGADFYYCGLGMSFKLYVKMRDNAGDATVVTATTGNAAAVGGGAAGGQRGRGDGGRSGVRTPPLAATQKAHEAAAGGGAAGRRRRAAGGGRSGGRCTCCTGLPEDRATARGAASRQSRRAVGRHVVGEEDGADGESEDTAAVVVHGRRSRASALNCVASGSV